MPRSIRRDDLHAPPPVITHVSPRPPPGTRGLSNSVPTAKKRQRFGQQEDLLLLQQVQLGAPYKASHGTIQRTWDRVAEQLNAHPDFHMRPVKGSTVKARFDTLLSRHREWVGGTNIRIRREGISENGEIEKEGDEGTEEREKRRKRDQRDGPFRGLMMEVVRQIDEVQAKEGDRILRDDRGGAEGDGDASGDGGCGQQKKRVFEEKEEGISRFLGKRRVGSSGAGGMDGERWRMERDGVSAQVSSSLRVRKDSLVGANGVVGRNNGGVEEEAVGLASLGGRDTPDLATVQQAMGELLKMQHAMAMRPNEGGLVTALEKMNEARLREEEEKTKQRDLELLIEKQRTKRQQMELDFERNERKRDREEQAKLITSLLERLQSRRE